MDQEQKIEELTNIVEALTEAVASMNGGSFPDKAQPNRYAVEREERKVQSELDRYAEYDGRSGNPRPTSHRRSEEIKRSAVSVPAPELMIPPVTPSRRSPPAEGGDSSDKIEFYCWKEGQLGTITLTGGEFKPEP